MLCSSVDIRLLPDWTIIIQLFIFLFVALTLNTYVIRPTIRIIHRRKEFTSDAATEAAKLTVEAEQLDMGRREVLAMALNEAYAEFAKRSDEARRKSDALIAEARAKSAELMKRASVSIASMEKQNEQEMEARAEELAGDIVTRVLAGR